VQKVKKSGKNSKTVEQNKRIMGSNSTDMERLINQRIQIWPHKDHITATDLDLKVLKKRNTIG